MTALFIDSPVFLHAVGAPGPATSASQTILRRAGSGEIDLHTAAECIQEVAFHRLRVGDRRVALEQVEAVRDLCRVHALDDAVLDRGIDLMRGSAIRERDAFIAATALLAGFEQIVTTDARCVAVPGVRPIDPRDVGR